MMRLAIEAHPFLGYSHAGPKVFLSRLVNSIQKQQLCDVRSPYLPNYDIALFAISDKSVYRKPYVLRVDGLYFDKDNTAGDSEKLNQIIFQAIEGSHGVIFVSKFTEVMVETFYKRLSVPTTIIHNKVPLEIFSPIGENMRSRLGLQNTDRVIVTSAHWRRHKRLEETIKLISLLRDKSQHSYKLLVLGKKPRHLMGTDSVIFCGEVKPNMLPFWYRSGNMYLHLAWIEPCGNTQIEAMACGLPVVCAKNGGIGETITAASGGIVSSSDDDYKYNRVNYYSPPEPDYRILVGEIESIFSHLHHYTDKIDHTTLDIDSGARQYVDFISRI